MILERILPILSDRERQIIQCTFIEGLSQKETGERIDLVKCMSHACNVLQLKSCKKQLNNKYLKKFIDNNHELLFVCHHFGD